MASILSFILNGIGIASFGLFVDQIAKGKDDANGVTHVELIIGSGDGAMGGAMPNIAIWNERGNRLGQYRRTSRHIDEGSDEVINIAHDQFSEGAQQATYIMLSNPDADAVCISALYITDTRVNTAVFGDVGQLCGMSWSISQRDIGDSHMRPKCVWLDGDGTEGINSQAMSFHLGDLVANQDRLKQYQERQDTLCGSTPRFAFWGNLAPNSQIPIFDPPLQYEVDSSNGGIGADMDIDRVLDKPGEFDRSVTMYHGRATKHRRSGGSVLDNPGSARPNRQKGAKKAKSNPNLNTLIVTPYIEHSARELCESATSRGPDTVSLNERLFCDMETKALFPLCGDNGHNTFCFDLEKRSLVLHGNVTSVHSPNVHSPNVQVLSIAYIKEYNSTAYW
ncbi:hypothetical protein F4801DRAFT_562368 [Xylaria longipes]|nr:hypothetical protein F4801DRAFT_562368 [Xylaria longipes]RYC55205.1 hypothetical protein CHU98_g11002 [Xylaria longipes]